MGRGEDPAAPRAGDIKSDARILGEPDFVEAILAQAHERHTRQSDLKRRSAGFDQVVERVAGIYRMDPQDDLAGGRQECKVAPRNLLCFWAVRELDVPLIGLGRPLGMIGRASSALRDIA